MGQTKAKQIMLFGAEPYPNTPGHTGDDTSIAAARDVQPRALTVRAQVMSLLHEEPMTVHETAEHLGMPVPTVQPRFSALRRMGLIKDLGERRMNFSSGKKAIVWVASIRGER